MGRSVIITTPIPSVDEVARRVGVSKARLRVLRKIVDGTYVDRRTIPPSSAESKLAATVRSDAKSACK